LIAPLVAAAAADPRPPGVNPVEHGEGARGGGTRLARVDAGAPRIAHAYYQAHCGCDVSQLLLPNTAHLFMVHRSLPSWVDYVVNWLAAHGLAGRP
jgi:hypothetical protein